MNSFQSLEQWENYFDHPTGGRLGVLNAIQVSLVCIPTSFWQLKQIRNRILVLWQPTHLPHIFLMALDVGSQCG